MSGRPLDGCRVSPRRQMGGGDARGNSETERVERAGPHRAVERAERRLGLILTKKQDL